MLRPALLAVLIASLATLGALLFPKEKAAETAPPRARVDGLAPRQAPVCVEERTVDVRPLFDERQLEGILGKQGWSMAAEPSIQESGNLTYVAAVVRPDQMATPLALLVYDSLEPTMREVLQKAFTRQDAITRPAGDGLLVVAGSNGNQLQEAGADALVDALVDAVTTRTCRQL